MNCLKCGNVLGPTDTVCGRCGTPVQNIPVQPNAPVVAVNSVGGAPVSNNVAPTPVVPTVEVVPMGQSSVPVSPPATVVNGNSKPSFLNFNGDNKMLIVASIGGLGILIIIIGIILGISKPKEKEKVKEKTADPVKTEEVVRYAYNGFEFPYLDNYIKEVLDTGELTLIDEKDKTFILLSIGEKMTLSDVDNDLSNVKSALTKKGCSLSSEERKDISNVSWIYWNATCTIDKEKYPTIVGFAKLGNYHLALSYIIDLSENANNTAQGLNNISKAIEGATYHGTTNFAPSDLTGTKKITLPKIPSNLKSKVSN